MAANVKAGKRFLSTIARRLDTLGAITRGQRQTGGQGCSGPRTIWKALCARGTTPILLAAAPGQNRGLLADDLRGGHRPVADYRRGRTARRAAADHDLAQPATGASHRNPDLLFEVFEQLMAAKVEGAIAAGNYDKGWRRSRRKASPSPIGAPSTRIRSPARSRMC
jgi:hypothetical protein